MRLVSEFATGSVAPLPLGEVGSPTGRREAPPDDKLRDPGEGFSPIDRPYPLTPTLSPWERGRTDGVATLRRKGVDARVKPGHDERL